MNKNLSILIASFLAISFLPVDGLFAQEEMESVERLEARIIYNAALKLMDEEEYSKALKRLDRIITVYSETEYAKLAIERKEQIKKLGLERKLIGKWSRLSLLTFGTLFTTWLAEGTAYLLDPHGEVGVVAGLTIGIPVGLTISRSLTQEARISDGQASLIIMSGLWGTWYGIGTDILFELEGRPAVGTVMVGGVLGLLTSTAIIQKWDMSRGRTALINLGGIVGTLYGWGTATLLDFKERPTVGMMLAGGILGLSAGTLLTKNFDVEKSYFTKHRSAIQIEKGHIEFAVPMPKLHGFRLSNHHNTGIDYTLNLVSAQF